jgi:hypothetical protein
VRSRLKVATPQRLEAIAPYKIPEGASLRVIARRPDSSIEPLLWIHQFNPKFARAYRYRSLVDLPAGTTVEVIPAGAGIVRLSLGSP